MSKKVAMFVTNPCTHDARVMKEASTLAGSGYDVRVYALSNAYNEPGVFEQDGYVCLLYTSPSPRDQRGSRMPSSA